MKNIIISLIAGVVIFLTSPVFAMISDQETTDTQILTRKNYKILHYPTSIVCTSYSKRNWGSQMDFHIQKQGNEGIGEMVIYYYPKALLSKVPFPQDLKHYQTSKVSLVRVRDIEIRKEYQKQGHETEALGTLIMALRLSPVLPKDVEMCLEYQSGPDAPHLEKFYKSFGFEQIEELSRFETKVMKVKLSAAKLPYHANQTEKK